MAGSILIQTEKITIEAQPTGDGLVLRPIGAIDEDVNFTGLLSAALGFGPISWVRFDLGGVASINSCGVREWLLFLEKARTKLRVEFENVSVVMAEQASIVPNLLGPRGSVVHSFQIPYYCSKCDQATVRSVATEDFKKNPARFLKPDACETRGCDLQFDALEDEYFRFLGPGNGR
ncbi:MAG: hypothetical protein IT285_12755 [Bdellovibrionales bacterium]|nr:hypothetical protein [Bdellovibrionales bacterium]